MKNFYEFILAASGHWVALMSGIASVIFWAASATVPDLSARLAFAIAAYPCLVFAAFRVWLAERRKWEARVAELETGWQSRYSELEIELNSRCGELQKTIDDMNAANSTKWSEGLFELQALIKRGQSIVSKMKRFGSRSDSLEFLAVELEWRQSVRNCLESYFNPADVIRLEAIQAYESDWIDYPDILNNQLKTVAASIDLRIKFLGDEVLKNHGR